DPIWVIVEHPIEHVINSSELEVIKRLESFGKARSEPSARAGTEETFDLVEAAIDYCIFILLHEKHAMMNAVTHDFPIHLTHRGRKPRVFCYDRRIQIDHCRKIAGSAHLYEP